MTTIDRRFDDSSLLDRTDRRHDPAYWRATSAGGMVAAAHYRATAAGVEILEEGGNAIDAAVAVSAALGVCEPAGSGLGGMAHMVVHWSDPGRTFTIEGPCRAPIEATPEAVLASPNRYAGYRAVAVPTNVAVLDHALRRYGTMSPEAVLSPAIALAESGVAVTPFLRELFGRFEEPLRQHSAGRSLLPADGLPSVGDVFRQPALATTLRRLARVGFGDFYTGEIGRTIVEDMRRNGGFLTARDFEAVPEPTEGEPVRARFHDLEVCTIGPPAGGLSVVQLVNLWAALDPRDEDLDDPDTAALLAAVIRRTRQDRKRLRLELKPGTVPSELSSAETASRAAAEIRRELAGLGETTHFVVTDRRGNMVSTTQSIERAFGSSEVTEELGFLHNGFMKAFKVEAKNHPHYLRPGAVARSNAAPTIALRDGRAVVAIGATGSERSASAIFQVLARLRRETPFEAVVAPRLHATPDGRVMLEQSRFPEGILRRLTGAGFTLVEEEPFAFKLGGLQLLVRDGDTCTGVADPRRDGAAGGPRA